MARNGLKRMIREVELFRRYMQAWQNVIEITEELHQTVLDQSVKDKLQDSAAGARDVQKNVITYLQQSETMFNILDEKLGEFPRSVQ